MELDKQHTAEFSVIISVYDGDRPDWFKSALQSIIDQTVQPSEILITRDGPINETLQDTIDSLIQASSSIEFQIIGTQSNMGRGYVLAMAVDAARHELVAIMDADDIAQPKRFESQIRVFDSSPETDVVGSWIEEFETEPNQPLCVRKVPEYHTDIVKYAKWRNPINQMTVMFRKNSVINVGNYQEAKYFEDMWLWYRMINAGSKFYNIPRALVLARGGSNIVDRRTGLKYVIYETKLLLKLLNSGYIGYPRFALMTGTRLPIRLLPQKVARRFFVKLLRSK